MLRLFIVRHAQTEGNALGLWEGSSDSPLTPRGEAQARELRDLLSHVRFTAAYSSDAGRAMRTAQVLLEGREIPLRTDALLRESDLGALERASDPVVDWDAPPAGLETFDKLLLRATQFLQRITTSHSGGDILIVGHNGSGKALIQALRGETRYPKELELGNASLSLIVIEGETIVSEHLGLSGAEIGQNP